MPGSPFRPPFRGGIKRATAQAPKKPNPRVSQVPKPASPNGTTSRAVRTPPAPSVSATTKSEHRRPMPPVRQGTKLGTPGRHG